jgi:uncharacterized phage protein (TIGR01671 family)
MKREIKFRIFRPAIGEMQMVTQIMWGNLLSHGDISFISTGQNDVDPDKVHLMQFTGLHDKNGKEIYEGDIISYSFQNGFGPIEHRGMVTYSAPRWHLDKLRIDLNNTSNGYIKDMSDGEYWLSRTQYDAEVIGNIYENPELLNK